MQRRQLLCLAASGLAALSVSTRAQTERQIRRIGFQSLGGAQVYLPRLLAFRAGMSALGWVEGRDYVIDARYADSITQDVAGVAAELLATRPDLLLATGDAVVRPLTKMTKTIPIARPSGPRSVSRSSCARATTRSSRGSLPACGGPAAT